MTAQLPAWLDAKVDQRLAMVDQAMPVVGLAGPSLIVTPLAEPPEGATRRDYDRWERTCDCCGKYCPYPKENFYTGHVQRTSKAGLPVIISFGICEEHRFDG
jgi:hypothetical protein